MATTLSVNPRSGVNISAGTQQTINVSINPDPSDSLSVRNWELTIKCKDYKDKIVRVQYRKP